VHWCAKDWHLSVKPFTAGLVIAALGAIFIPIGIALYLSSASLVQYVQSYSDQCALGSSCNISFVLPEKMSAPVYFYYRLDGFPQNQRRYVASVSTDQLRGVTSYSIDDCDPVETNSSGFNYYPCGLTASTFFNDQFNLYLNGQQLSGKSWSSEGIAWTSDKTGKFKSRDLLSTETNIGDRGLVLPSLSDETLMNWMRVSTFQTFRKLFRVINDVDLASGSNLTLSVSNQFSIPNFESVRKSVVLSTVSWIGGKNPFLGVLYIVSGAVMVIGGIAVSVLAKLLIL
jgi:hypothetical protein